MSTLRRLAKEQRAVARECQYSHHDFLVMLCGRKREDVWKYTFEAYEESWLDWCTVAELEEDYKVSGQTIRRAIRQGLFERYVSHDDKRLRVRRGDFIAWMREEKPKKVA